MDGFNDLLRYYLYDRSSYLGYVMSEENKGVLLDEECFRCLVRGGVVHSGKIRIALSDIGFKQMADALSDAIQGIDVYKDHHKK